MELVIDPHGTVRCVYGESIELTALGTPSIQRASHVEPDARGDWWADLLPVGGPMLGPFDRRSGGLEAERAWLQEHWLQSNGLSSTDSSNSCTLTQGGSRWG